MAIAADPARPVGRLALLALGINGIVGVGIFFAPADIAARAPGAASVAVFGLTALALLPVALVFARLGSRFDVDGGPVVYARAGLGDTAGFVVGWISYVSAIASLSAVLAGLIAASGPALGLQGPVALRLGASLTITVIALVVASGLAISAKAWTALTGLKLLPLLALAVLFVAVAPGWPASGAGETGVRSYLSAGLTAMFALQGFEIVPVIAGRTRAPERTVPFATVTSLVASALLYVVLQTAAVVTLPGLASSPAPLAETAGVLGGPFFGQVVSAGTSVSALGIAFGMTVTTPHYLAALARGGTLGMGLSEVDARGTPRRALLLTWLLVLVLIQLGDRGQLFALASLAVLTQYVATSASLMALARRRERGLTLRDAWPALPATVVGVALAAGASLREAAVAVGALVLGFVLRAVTGQGDKASRT
jgi:APA family basic amino acid/polyamine antiporter